MDFKKVISESVSKHVDVDHKIIYDSIEIPPDSNLGDYALPCFIFAKSLKKSPQNIALELKDVLTTMNLKEDHLHFEQIINQGSYLNFFINKELLAKNVLTKIFKEKECYASKEKTDVVVLVESPGPNTNKPLHLGHLRNILLGQSITNILKFKGKDAHIVNVVNDRGVHICKSMLAYEKFGNHSEPNKKSDHFVGDYYVKYAQIENEETEKEIQEMLLKWENHDEHIRNLCKKMNDWALDGFKETYKKLGFNIEKEYLESDTYLSGRDIILDAYKKGLFEKDENGAIIINLEDKGLGKKVLLRANGTSVYITQDIFMAKARHDDFDFDEMIYVVGNEQEYHFKVLFEVFKRLKWPFAEKCYHFSYGMVGLPEGKMKSREGTVIDADDLIDEVTKMSYEELKNRYKDLSEQEMKKRANIIGLSAIRFFFLKHDPMKNFIYNPKESLSFDGETGPYIEYSLARINSIFKKFQEKDNIQIEKYIHNADLTLLKEKNEFEIIKLLEEYPEIIDVAAKEFNPGKIAHYLIRLAQVFNEFYHANPILNSEEELKKSRLYLVYCIQQVLKSAMKLLNIEEIEEM